MPRPMPGVRNWGGTLHFHPAAIERPGDVEQLQAVLRRADAQGRRVRVMGARHSWSPLIETNGVLLDLRRFDGLRMQGDAVAVGAGVRLHTLNDFLDRHGRALLNLGFITAQTAVGAVMTGTHGSGPAAVL